MRGSDHQQSEMFSYISAERRVSNDHPLHAIRTMVDAAIAEERHHAVAQVLGDVSVESGDRIGGRAMVPGHSLAPFLGIELRRDLSGADQSAEQHRQMAP